MKYGKKLKSMLKDLGIAKVGYGYLGDILPESLKHLKTGISIAFRLSDQVIDDIHDGPTYSYFHHYRTVNFRLDQVMLSTVSKLQEWGYLAMPIAASQSINTDGNRYRGIFPHKTAATRAGIGWVGKSGCLVTDEYGPRVRLGTILTNMEVDYDKPIKESKCGKCTSCVKACPALAIRGGLWYPGIARKELVDARACSEHMSTYYKHVGRGSVCGICIKSCPQGNKVIKKAAKEV
ncbi:MAG: epoxyqueuosine reductase [Candidatus Petromonas sp.]|jgi:epoxyqueuosine reductase QueG|nr:epoxyqueuosine reductase [Candidatus Petromonas sp.]